MIHIALCDDNQPELDGLVSSLTEYVAQHSIQLSAFSRAHDLLNAVSIGNSFDVYILDVVMPEMTGIELGLKLRALEDKGLIIYLTTSPEFAVDSYRTRAFNYLLKPVNLSELISTLDRALDELVRTHNTVVIARGKDAVHRLHLDEILYVENYSRCVRYHLVNGKTVDSISLREPFLHAIHNLLENPCFVSCGASVAINLNHVSSIETNAVIFNDESRCPIPHKAINPFRNAWMNYWLEDTKRWRL